MGGALPRRQQRRPHGGAAVGETFALHLIPSGILTPGVNNVIGNGVVVDPACCLKELSGLEERDVDTTGLMISADAHLLMPYHVAIDKVTERFLGNKKIGTTGRGIGPCYQDKIARVGVRVADVLDEKILAQKVEAALELKNQILVKIYNRKALEPARVVDEVLAQAEGFSHRIADTRLLLNQALERGETVLLEGSAGHSARRRPRHLPVCDLVQPHRGRRGSGLGYRPQQDHHGPGHPQGVHHARRVGTVPHRAVRRMGRVPGQDRRRGGRHHRPRPALRLVRRRHRPLRHPRQRHHRLLLTKLDVLSSLDQVPICVAYEVDGERVTTCR